MLKGLVGFSGFPVLRFFRFSGTRGKVSCWTFWRPSAGYGAGNLDQVVRFPPLVCSFWGRAVDEDLLVADFSTSSGRSCVRFRSSGFVEFPKEICFVIFRVDQQPEGGFTGVVKDAVQFCSPPPSETVGGVQKFRRIPLVVSSLVGGGSQLFEILGLRVPRARRAGGCSTPLLSLLSKSHARARAQQESLDGSGTWS